MELKDLSTTLDTCIFLDEKCVRSWIWFLSPVAVLPTNPTFFIDAENIFTDMYFINIHQDFCNIQYNCQFCFDEVTRLCLKWTYLLLNIIIIVIINTWNGFPWH